MGPWAVLVSVAGVLATADLAIAHVLLLVLLVLSTSLTRLPLRAAAWTGAASLCLGLLAGLRVRLLTGHPGPLLTIALGYAVAFGAVFAVRERRQRQRENEGFVAELAREHRELEDAYARLREYARHTAELAASEERNRIAREIHDVLAHALGAGAGGVLWVDWVAIAAVWAVRALTLYLSHPQLACALQRTPRYGHAR